MQIINNEHIVAFDVDETLFMHSRHGGGNEEYNRVVKNPYSNSYISGKQNNKHIELMKQYKARGLFIIVWSKAGVLWAEAVVKHLKLEGYVDLVVTKFDRYVDDLEADKILGERVYLK